MKIRIICTALVLILSLFMAGCCLSHEWAEATCTAPKTCTKCGEIEGEALGHTWQDATCIAAKTCAVCNETDGDALGHVHGEWVVIQEATYLDHGIRAISCITCGDELERETFEKPLVENGVFQFTKNEYAELLDAAVKEYGDEYRASVSGNNVYVDNGYNVNILIYFFDNDNKEIVKKIDQPLEAVSIMGAFPDSHNRNMMISVLVDSCITNADDTTLKKVVSEIENNGKSVYEGITFTTGTVETYDVLFISIGDASATIMEDQSLSESDTSSEVPSLLYNETGRLRKADEFIEAYDTLARTIYHEFLGKNTVIIEDEDSQLPNCYVVLADGYEKHLATISFTYKGEATPDDHSFDQIMIIARIEPEEYSTGTTLIVSTLMSWITPSIGAMEDSIEVFNDMILKLDGNYSVSDYSAEGVEYKLSIIPIGNERTMIFNIDIRNLE